MKPVKSTNRAKTEKPTTFKPGQSGNPNGRPKQPKEFKALVKSNTVPALEAVIRIMNDDTAKDSDRIKAAELIIDRAYGKSVQPIDADVKADVNIFALPKEVVSLID